MYSVYTFFQSNVMLPGQFDVESLMLGYMLIYKDRKSTFTNELIYYCVACRQIEIKTGKIHYTQFPQGITLPYM